MPKFNTSVCWQSFFLAKRGNTPEEYEDAFAGDPASGRFAIADGASESSFAGAWAKVIVEAFVEVPGRWSSWLPSAREQWTQMFQGREMSWFTEAKFEEGAFATLLGLAFKDSGSWAASAVGDCCLFHVRQDKLRRAFPVRRSTDFNNRPQLLCSRLSPLPEKTQRKRIKGNWHQKDIFLLMTDALAQWFLQSVEAGQRPWQTLTLAKTQVDFAVFIEELRDRKEMRNDDVTLLTVQAGLFQ